MATLNSLKRALEQNARAAAPSSLTQPLSDTQYSAGFDILVKGSGWMTYQDFIIPQLSQLLATHFEGRIKISVLEIGPGPKSVLGYLPDRLRRKVRKYTAFEHNSLFATRLEEWLCSTSETESPFPCLEDPPNIHRKSFILKDNIIGTFDDGKYDFVLFCHSMYGMKPKHKFIEQALEMLIKSPDGMVAVFHRQGTLHLDGLVCHQAALFPTGVARVVDNNEKLDCFAAFIAGFISQDVDVDNATRVDWRKTCRALGRREETYPDHLMFSSPNIMATFTQHAITMPELTAQALLVKSDRAVKNREARLHCPASIIRPTEVGHIQQCVRWALKHQVGLTVIGGGHSGHCLWPHVVSVDMSAFDQIHIITGDEKEGDSGVDCRSLVVVEAGCKVGDIIRKTMAAGLTVPLGARPSVGAGSWLQGGIGHLARLHGLACDAIIGAVVVSVDSCQILCIGNVPSQYQPAGSIRPEKESDLLWAMKGAGTNVGIVVSVTFKTYAAPTYLTRNWVIPLSNHLEAQLRLNGLDRLVARKLPRNCSADMYIYWDTGQLHLGVTVFESYTIRPISAALTPTSVDAILGPEADVKVVDGVGLFETEMYMCGMHGGHGSGKTSSFKRCLFLKCIGERDIADRLVAAVETRPSQLCYLHLLQGGGAVDDVGAEASAFGCRDWDFACVITGVWPRDLDGTDAAQSAIRWVYNVAGGLLPLSSGAYGADLGPDPRDTALAAGAFGPNQQSLDHLKHGLDPHGVLAYVCPLPTLPRKAPMEPKLILLVTGEAGAGKDYSARIWVSSFTERGLTARVVSISDATKQEYAAATGADLSRLLLDRAYKEQHRPALTSFFQEQVRQRPQLPEEHFLNLVHETVHVDVLLITGMRDDTPVAAFSHLVPNSRLLDVHVQADHQTRQIRRGSHGSDDNDDNGSIIIDNNESSSTASDYRPSLIFDNNTNGHKATKQFSKQYLLPFFHDDLQRLASMVRSTPNFPRQGTEFRHVLGISQQAGGLALCTYLLQTHFTRDWTKVDAMACCETGGFIFASPLALQVDVPLVLIREAGKLSPPTASVDKLPSNISSLASDNTKRKQIEMEQGLITQGASVVVVDDVFSTGKTLCAVLQLLLEVGISAEDISVIVVAEFPIHRGRELLRRCGFSRINIQSLLVFGGT